MHKKFLIYGLGAVGAYLILKKSAGTTSPLAKVASSLGIKPGAAGSFFGSAPIGTNLATGYGTRLTPQAPGLNPLATSGAFFSPAGVSSVLSGLGNLFKGLPVSSSSQTTPQKPGITPNTTAGAPSSTQIGNAKQQQQTGIPCPYLDLQGNCTTDVNQAVFDPNGIPLGGGVNPNAPLGFQNNGQPIDPSADYIGGNLTIVGYDAQGVGVTDPSQVVYTLDNQLSPNVQGLDANGVPTVDPGQVVYDTGGNPVDENTLPSIQTVGFGDSTGQAYGFATVPDVSGSDLSGGALDTSGG